MQTGFNPMNTQQSTLSNIIVGPAVTTSTQKNLNQDAIKRHLKSASETPGQYWQVEKPTRTLKIGSSQNYVNKNYPHEQGYNRFVYWPDFLVAGTISNIVNAFRGAGVQSVDVREGNTIRSFPLTEQIVAERSIDPLNPMHMERIKSMGEQTTVGKNKARHTFEEYVKIGNALKANKKGASTTTTGGAKTTGAGAVAGKGPGSRNPLARQQALVRAFEMAMDQVLAGQDPEKVIDVGKFDVSKFSGPKPANTPLSREAGGKTQSYRPIVNTNRGPVAIPVIVQPAYIANLEQYIRSVIGASKYSGLVNEILQSLNNQIQARASGTQGALQGALQTQGQGTGIMNMLPQTGFQTQQLSPRNNLPQIGGGMVLPPQNLNIMSQLSTSGGGSPYNSPQGTTSPAPMGLNMPNAYQLPNLPGTQFTGPTQGNFAKLPSLPVSLSNIQGGLPNISLPSGLGGSPQ